MVYTKVDHKLIAKLDDLYCRITALFQMQMRSEGCRMDLMISLNTPEARRYLLKAFQVLIFQIQNLLLNLQSERGKGKLYCIRIIILD